jgi:hypothetical protein
VHRFAHRSRFLIVFACVAMVVLRVGGLHVHMCLDGSEPPMSFHIEDSGVHHLDEVATGDAHEDRDLAIAADLVVKKPFADLDLSLLAALGVLLLFLLARPRELLPFPSLPARLRSARTRLRPPLRGPPAPGRLWLTLS